MKRKFILNMPGHKWSFYARDIQEAEEIILSGLEEEEVELTDEQLTDMRGDEMYSDYKERDL